MVEEVLGSSSPSFWPPHSNSTLDWTLVRYLAAGWIALMIGGTLGGGIGVGLEAGVAVGVIVPPSTEELPIWSLIIAGITFWSFLTIASRKT